MTTPSIQTGERERPLVGGAQRFVGEPTRDDRRRCVR